MFGIDRLIVGLGEREVVSETRTTITRRTFLRSAWLGTVASFVTACTPLAQAARRRPNIIWIMADDLGYGDIGVYGQTRIRTPYLDDMASQGMRFTSAYTAYPVCRPARCCLMTGYHTGHAYIRENGMKYPLRPGTVTVAKVLKKAGYVTGMFGKWALGNEETTGTPDQQGFSEFWGWLDQTEAHNYYPAQLWHNDDLVALPGNDGLTAGSTYAPDFLIDKSIEFISAHASERFFAYLPFTLPHAGTAGKGGSMDLPVPSTGEYIVEDWPESARRYAAMVTRLDVHVGRILETLDRLGLSEDTIVFFTSDNGPHDEGNNDPEFLDSNGPLTGIKRSLNEGGIRVPMIVRWTGTVPAGSVSDFAWAFWDFLPTAAELAGMEVPSGLDGRSILPTLCGEEQVPAPYLYWEQNQLSKANQAIDLRLQAVRVRDWKLMAPVDEPPRLFNLAADLSESNDLAARYPDRVAELLEIAREAHDPPVILPELFSG